MVILELNSREIPRLKETLVGGPARGIHWATKPDIDPHFQHMKQDFVGLPELCFVHGMLIALIRREENLAHHVPTFLSLWETESDFLRTHLNSRWLLSACDTIACHGPELQRSHAAVLSALFHSFQLHETERQVMRDTSYDPAKYRLHVVTHAGGSHIPLWDGIKADAFENGDSCTNMLRYVVGLLDRDPLMGPICRTMIARALAGDTILSRLARHNPGLLPPMLSGGAPDTRPHLTGAINGFNIVLFEGKFFVIPQRLGRINLMQKEDRERPEIVVTDSVLNAVQVTRQRHPS